MITPGLSHPPQFLFGVGFGSVFLYISLPGYEKGLNVLSLWRTYEYLKRRALFKLPSKNKSLLILTSSCFNKTHFQSTCVLFILSGQTPSSNCSTSWPQTQESMKTWWGAENTSWASSLCLMDSIPHGHAHYCICIWISAVGLFLCLGFYHLTVLTSVARRVDLLTKHSLRSFNLSKSEAELLNTHFINSLFFNNDRKARPGIQTVQALVSYVLTFNTYNIREGPQCLYC